MSHVRIIKKYPNRRLYDTDISSYVTLEDVRQLIVDREPFVVRDARSNEDITRGVLMQIIAEHEERGQPIFTNELLLQVIRFRGDAMQGLLGSFLERSLAVFLEQQQTLRGLVGQAPWGLLTQLAERNLDLWRSLQQNLGGGPGPSPPAPPARGRGRGR